MFTESVMPSSHLIICCPFLLWPSILRIFSSELAICIRWPKYWSFSFSISPSHGYSGFISFRIDWFGLFAVQGTLKSLLQHHSSKASVLQWPDFFMVQFSYLYKTTGKTIALTNQFWVSEWEKSLSCVQLFVTLWTEAYQAPPSMGFSRQEDWSGVPLPFPGHISSSIQTLLFLFNV